MIKNRKAKIMIITLILIVISILGSCGLFDPTDKGVGKGPLVTRDITVQEFDRVYSSGIADVNIIKSDSQEVSFTAQKEVLEAMTYEVRNGTLILGFEEDTNIKTSKDITIDIQTYGIVSIVAEGTGDWYLRGSIQTDLKIDISGTGDVDAYDQKVVNCQISSTGTGSAWVSVEDQLDIDLEGTGDVYYKGRPIVNVDVTGTGQLIHEN